MILTRLRPSIQLKFQRKPFKELLGIQFFPINTTPKLSATLEPILMREKSSLRMVTQMSKVLMEKWIKSTKNRDVNNQTWSSFSLTWLLSQMMLSRKLTSKSMDGPIS